MTEKSSKYVASEAHVRRFVESLKGKQVVIYGGGKVGTRVCQSLRAYGIVPTAIWDIRYSVIKEVDGIAVTNPDPEGIRDNPDVVILMTVYSENVCRSIAADLKSRGAVNVVYKRSLINAILYLECHQQVERGTFQFDMEKCHLCPVSKEIHGNCEIYSRYLTANSGVASDVDLSSADRFVIRSMGVLITNNCNLTCQGCNHLRDLYKPSDNVRIEADAIIADLRRVLEVTDFIERLVIVGGEAFVHKDLENILERIVTLPRIGMILVITNGTVIPKSQRIFELLANRRVMVEISGYGDFLPVLLRDNVQTFIKHLQQYRVSYRHLETLEWQDFGDFGHRGYTKQQHLAVYNTCCFVSNDLFDGKLFKCSRSVFATKLGRIPDYPNDYVDVRATPLNELRGKLKGFFENRYPEVCQHCNGTSDQRMPAGIQVSKGAARREVQQDRSIVPLSSLLSGLPLNHSAPVNEVR